jgi:hypothetical protein
LRAIQSGKASSAEDDNRIVEDALDALGDSLTDEEAYAVREALANYSAVSGNAGYSQVHVAIGGEIGPEQDTIFNQINARAATWATRRVADLVSGVDETTRDAVRKAVSEGLATGRTAVQIAGDIEGIGDADGLPAFGSARAALIANTEIANANSEGALAGYRAIRGNGVQVRKVWLVAPGERVCEICDENAAQGPLDLDVNFVGGVSAPTQHPRCRCAVSPHVTF